MSVLGFGPLSIAGIAIVSALAFAVRGLTGFGSAMIGIAAMSLWLPPAQVVPAFLALELATTVNLLPSVWRQIDWRALPWLLAGAAAATPLGLQVLAHWPIESMRLLVSGCLLAVAALMLLGVGDRLGQRGPPGPAGSLAAGAASGLLNGAAGVGGPPVVVFYFATASAAVSRASLIMYFLIVDLYALLWAAGDGLFRQGALSLVAVALPPGLIGLWAGGRLYRSLDEATLRRGVWWLLALLGALGCAAVLGRRA